MVDYIKLTIGFDHNPCYPLHKYDSIVLMTFGEAIWQPRFLQYVARTTLNRGSGTA